MVEEAGPSSENTAVRVESAVLLANRYRLGAVIGSGGFGTVYRTHDTLLDRSVAIKLIRRAADEGISGERFLREARTTARFQHPNVVGLYDAGEDPSGRFLVLELIEGESLSALLRRGPLPVDRAISVVRQIAVALAAGHRAGIIHRDLKPDNVLLAENGDVKLADFGLARLAGQSHLTRPDQIAGTPRYMAPEQIEKGNAVPASDVFALGVLFHEALTGISPFHAGTEREMLARIVSGEPDRLPESLRADEGIAALISSMLQRDPPLRPTAAAVAERLGGGSAVRRDMRVRSWVVAAAAVVAITTFLLLKQDRLTDAPRASAITQKLTLQHPDIVARLRSAEAAQGSGFRIRKGAGEVVIQGPGRAQDALLPPEASIRSSGNGRIEISGPPRAVKNAATTLAIVDALTGYDFFKEPNLFTGTKQSARLISADLDDYPVSKLTRAVASATGWPVILHNPETASPQTITAAIHRAPWDATILSILDRSDLRPRREGNLWSIASEGRWQFLAGLQPPSVFLYRPKRISLTSAAKLLEPARSSRGVIALNRRLNSLVINDHWNVFPDYNRILETVGESPLPIRPGRPFSGQPITMTLANADIVGVIDTFSKFSGLSVVVDPEVKGSVTVELKRIPWDQALDAILNSQGLTYILRNDVLQVLPESKIPKGTAVHTLRLKNEDPEFFRQFSRTLSKEGTLAIDHASRTVVVRDRAPFAESFARWARSLDETKGLPK